MPADVEHGLTPALWSRKRANPPRTFAPGESTTRSASQGRHRYQLCTPPKKRGPTPPPKRGTIPHATPRQPAATGWPTAAPPDSAGGAAPHPSPMARPHNPPGGGISRASRARAVERMRAWRKKNPERAREITRKAWRKNAAKYNARRAHQRDWLKRMTRYPLETSSGMQITVGSKLDRPLLTYLDRHGNLHREEELSAEDLIAAWKKAQVKKRKKELKIEVKSKETRP